MADDQRDAKRRLTDAELEACIIEIKSLLPQESRYINGSRKRTIGVTALVGSAVGIVSLVQILLLNPITKDMEGLQRQVATLDAAVRSHHENSSKEYVLKEDYEADMGRLLTELSELKGMVMHMGQATVRPR